MGAAPGLHALHRLSEYKNKILAASLLPSSSHEKCVAGQAKQEPWWKVILGNVVPDSPKMTQYKCFKSLFIQKSPV